MAGLSGDAHKFMELFEVSDSDNIFISNRCCTYYKYLSIIQSILDAEKFENNIDTQKRLNNFFLSATNEQLIKALPELMKIAQKAISEITRDDYKKRFQKLYDECIELINDLDKSKQKDSKNLEEEKFLEKDFGIPSFGCISIESNLIPIIEQRYKEASHCLKLAPLAAVILCGSILEVILLDIAIKKRESFEKHKYAKNTKAEKLSLAQLIDIAYDLGLLGEDIKTFSHVLRDFRNYVHPYKQMLSKFNPDSHTAQICMQVLKAAIARLYVKKSPAEIL